MAFGDQHATHFVITKTKGTYAKPIIAFICLLMDEYILQLPQEMQEQLLRLPADFAGKLASRVAARTLKRVFL